MQQYQLKEDEVCLFESEVFEKESIKYYDLMLTNYNIVLCYTNRGKIKGKKAVVSTYPITEVKFYQEMPFIKLDKNIVEVYMKNCVLKFDFSIVKKLGYSKKFYNEIEKLLTGKDSFVRASEKIKGTIDKIDTTWGIDTVASAKNILTNITTGNSKKGKVGSILETTISAVSNSITAKKEEGLSNKK